MIFKLTGHVSGPHGAWVCGSFKQFDVAKRWDCAKQHELCFCSLGDSHLRQQYNSTRARGINTVKKFERQSG